MKGVYCVKNGQGQIKGYYASQDLDADKAYYDNEEYKNEKWWGWASKNNPHASLNYEITEVTDNPEYEVLKYILPQVPRITYEQELLDGIANKRVKLSRLTNAVDWFCEAYPTQHYSIVFYTKGKRTIFRTLRRKGEEVGHFRFSKKGATPVDEEYSLSENEQEK